MMSAILVHGGAGAIAPERIPPARKGCEAAALMGWEMLRQGGSALEAVIAATIALEDNPLFNAGTGAVLNDEGEAELDAGLMDGATLAIGAVIGLRRIKNPILLAQRVLVSPEVLLAGPGAERFAAQHGIASIDPQHFIDAHRHRQMAVVGGGEDGGGNGSAAPGALDDPAGKHGTVGAVAIDAQGHVAAASSTGGYADKPLGRVGDTPIAGAGFYAEDGAGAASCTGQGEYFIRLTIARRAAEAMARGMRAQAAADMLIAMLGTRLHGTGGLIVIDPAGSLGWGRNTEAMPYAYLRADLAVPQSGA